MDNTVTQYHIEIVTKNRVKIKKKELKIDFYLIDNLCYNPINKNRREN